MKKYLALVLALVMVLSLAACGGSGNKENASTATEAPKQDEAEKSDAEEEKPAEEPKVDFPTKAITLISPYTAGGSNDMTSRIIADAMGDILDCTITVLNVPGAGGSVGAVQAAAEKPDGYTLFMSAAGCISVVPYTSTVSYDIDSFDVIGQATDLAFVLVVPNDFPADNIDEFVEYAKENPGLNYGTPGANSSQEIFMHQLEQYADIELTHVPYGGAADVNAAIMGGHLEVGCLLSTDTVANLADGQYKALGVSSAEQDEVVPDVATFVSQGYDITSTCFTTLVAPAGVDPAVLTILRDAYTEAMASDYVNESFEKMGFPNCYMSAEESEAHMREVTESFKNVIAALNS